MCAHYIWSINILSSNAVLWTMAHWWTVAFGLSSKCIWKYLIFLLLSIQQTKIFYYCVIHSHDVCWQVHNLVPTFEVTKYYVLSLSISFQIHCNLFRAAFLCQNQTGRLWSLQGRFGWFYFFTKYYNAFFSAEELRIKGESC